MRMFKALLDLAFPRLCAICKDRTARGSICGRCWESIVRNRTAVLPADLISGFACDAAFAACAYKGAMKILLHEFKYGKKDYLGKLIAGLMTEYIRELPVPLESVDALIPIPLAAPRLRQREFNQARVLSCHIAEAFEKTVYDRILVRVRNTSSQTDLDARQRCINVCGSFAVTQPALVQNKNILLVDDVLTTGATASEAARVLKECGASRVWLIAAANAAADAAADAADDTAQNR